MKRTLGKQGPTVSAIGLGAMGMSGITAPRTAREHRHHSRRARCGITLLDTGDFYGMRPQRALIREALKAAPRQLS